MALDGFEGEFGTGRREAAVTSPPGAEQQAIPADQDQEETLHGLAGGPTRSRRLATSSTTSPMAGPSTRSRSITTHSTPRRLARWRRNVSRIARLRRLRLTASFTSLRVRPTPSRDTPSAARATCRTALRPRILRPSFRTGPKEPREVKRWRRGRRSTRSPRGMGEALDGDALAALGAARVDHGAASGGLHAHAKAVRLLAVSRRRLEGAFHGGVPLKSAKRGNPKL